MNSKRCFGSTFRIFLNLESQANVSSQIIVLPLGKEFFIIDGLKSLLQLSLLWLWRCTLSIIFIRLSFHKFGNILTGNGALHNFIFERLHMLSYDKKNFVELHFSIGMSRNRVRKNPMIKLPPEMVTHFYRDESMSE